MAQKTKTHPRERSDDHSTFDYQHYLERPLKVYRKYASKLFSQLARYIRTHQYNKLYMKLSSEAHLGQDPAKPSAILCLDEARGFFDPRFPKGTGYEDRFLGFRPALRYQSKVSDSENVKRFFAILLDTSAKVADFSPPHEQDPSLKWVDPETKKLFPPIFEIDSMDLFAGVEGGEWEELRRLILTNSGKLQYPYTLGRPLWGVILQGKGQPARGTTRQDIEDIARVKVLGTAQDRHFITEIQGLAMLSYRINFNIIPVYDLADQLTADYLRYILDVDPSRMFIQTFQLSEPVLAMTAQREMTRSSEIRAQAIMSLYRNITNGTVNVGDAGELTAALILLFAVDTVQPVGGPRPLRLSTFLSALFPVKLVEGIQLCLKDSDSLRPLWDNGTIYFNHFVRLVEDPNENTLQNAYKRGAAIFSPTCYIGCDLILPIYMAEEDEISYVMIQVKNRSRDKLTQGFRNESRACVADSARLLEQTSGCSRPRSHLGIMMSLRGQQEPDAQLIYSNKVSKDVPEENRYVYDNLEWLVIAAVGMNFAVYPGLLHPRDSVDHPGYSNQVLNILKKLLATEVEVHADGKSSYRRNLLPLH
ncbi:uncharacterized protein ASPGLDRAFT_61906 [Aspergillus glaucus CBS 516.65]|uniref:Uncharacterized protein n=1 Tax=Aspergillus glaucus CBS 516.65 TaxID=1160497 RepID=A0A1L9V635_ASPGL|nr:hypothetical protein ASPGLDRAFT_61906 [Aspergillus glaucus CBS 516.65]OJJ79312.1 hypothetical protein ASPGLDRAFT_61906 [Aspergillus glaucus CBS 516.65]